MEQSIARRLPVAPSLPASSRLMQLEGIHHLTAVTADAPGNHAFYTGTLGLRLVKKTVNQDDTSVYHLFYADGLASPGTDITFFDFETKRERRGTRSVVRTGFRVKDRASLDYWKARLAEAGVTVGEIVSRDGRDTLDFEDPEGQRLMLVVDETGAPGNPWARSPVPAEHQILGLGPIVMSVPDLSPTKAVLTALMLMKPLREYELDGSRVHVFGMGKPGPLGELHVAVEPHLDRTHPGAGGVHHVAFAVPDADYEAWAERLRTTAMPNSGPVDRYWFRSLYFREPGGVLFELATNGPGFATDEPMETLGETLSLPPFLEGRRAAI